MISFASDYLEGCHPSVLRLLEETNTDQTPGYGLDPWCAKAAGAIREAFSCEGADIHFLVGGTQTNMTVIASALRPYEGVLCAETGHINVHETGAVEGTGHKVLALPGTDGKIRGAQIREALALQADDEHTVRPGMVYISVSTELGTVYSRAELEDISAACRDTGLYLYIDGARLGYGLAAAGGDLTPADLARNADVFTVGGTKQGALFGEAVVIVRDELKPRFRYMIKHGGGMLAKGRLLGIQFAALMKDGLYFTLSHEAVAKAARIRQALKEEGFPLLIDSPTNQLFPVFTEEQLAQLGKEFVLSPWEKTDDARIAARICVSWCTPDGSVDRLIDALRNLKK